MRIVLTLLIRGGAIVAGGAIGAVAAFFATYYACVLIDLARGASGGNGVVTVGWLFCFITVPAGLICGGYIGLALGRITAEWLM